MPQIFNQVFEFRAAQRVVGFDGVAANGFGYGMLAQSQGIDLLPGGLQLIDQPQNKAARIGRFHKWRQGIEQERALTEFIQAPIQRYGHLALLDRIWHLRANLTSYDASYVALAELLGVDLLTVDRRLAGVPGIRCQVEVL